MTTHPHSSDRAGLADKSCAETPMRDHVANFWRLLETETVRISVDCYQHGERGFWNGLSTFSDDVAKAIVASRPTPANSDMAKLADQPEVILRGLADYRDKAYERLLALCGTRNDAPRWDDIRTLLREREGLRAALRSPSGNGVGITDEQIAIGGLNREWNAMREALTQIDTLAVCTGVVNPAQHRNMLENIARIARAALAAVEPARGVDLTDPVVVHANMLRGTIAKPTWGQIKHLYPEEFATLPAPVTAGVGEATKLETFALELSEYLISRHVPRHGFSIGIGSDLLFVYFYGPKRDAPDCEAWCGTPIQWHYDVGPAIAFASQPASGTQADGRES